MEEIKEIKTKSHGFAWVLLTIFAVLIIGGLLIWRYFKARTILEISSGEVTRNAQVAKNGETLKSGDKLKTTENTDATVIFKDGSQLRLDSNTEITLRELEKGVSVYQTLGRTWSRVMKLSGTQTYEVETPTAVATVRGTAFSILVGQEDTDIDTEEGVVDVSDNFRTNKIVVQAGNGTTVRRGQRQLIKRLIREENRNRKLRRVSGLGLDDLARIKKLIERARAGQLNLTEDQKSQLEPLVLKFQATNGKVDASMAPDIAQALAIIDPENFSDTAHWTQVLQFAGPLIEKFQLLKTR